MVVCRSEEALDRDIRSKIALFANLPIDRVISARDVDSIYKVPLYFRAEGVDDQVLSHFGLETAAAGPLRLGGARQALRRGRHAGADRDGRQVHPAGRRLPVGDRGAQPRRRPPRRRRSRSSGWTPSGSSRVDGRRRARASSTASSCPAASACAASRARSSPRASRASAACRTSASASGMQVAVAEFARHVAGMDGANSTEFDPETPFPVIDLLPEQKEVRDMGGTMRLGADPVKLHEGTRAREIYGEAVIYERHRHRYEVNNHLRKRRLEQEGLVCSRHVARRPAGRDHRAARPPVLRRVAVPPRVQVAAAAAAAAVPRVRGRRARARARAGARGRAARVAAEDARAAAPDRRTQ